MSVYNYKKMGLRIVQRRKELSISQKELASKLKITNNHLSNIERGKALPGLETFFDLCRELKISPDYIVSGTIFPDANEEILCKLKLCSDNDRVKISQIIDVFIKQA